MTNAQKASGRARQIASALAMTLCLAAAAPAPDASSARDSQPAGFHRVEIGRMRVTALYDGYVPIYAKQLNGASAEEIANLLDRAFLQREGDLQTAVNAFLVDLGNRVVLVDAGMGNFAGPNTGHLLANLRAAGFAPEDVDDILITHLHPDHMGGLVASDGTPVFPRATVHVAEAEAAFWLDAKAAANLSGLEKQVRDIAVAALGPYRSSGRFATFRDGEAPVPSVESLAEPGHTSGHTGYIFGTGADRILLWGDLVHSYSVQLPMPNVTFEHDGDPSRAAMSRNAVLRRAAAERWWIGAAHLPFPGLGHVRSEGATGYAWAPVEYAPIARAAP
jgi:glyoxylase-like metal-dependent hydrolase (beta-lactamase superfamily II)